MPSFYDALFRYYDEVFPVDPDAKLFLDSFSANIKGPVLDIGCATGGYALYLGQKGNDVTGVDLNEAMVLSARKKAERLEMTTKFWVGDMLNINSFFNKNSFEAAYCMGNTLPHLNSLLDVEAFVNQMSVLLKKGGKLAIQVLNYDKILKEKPDNLPPLESDSVVFERKYEYRVNGKILFHSTLVSKNDGTSVSSSTELLPLRRTALINLLSNNGFNPVKALSGYSLKPATPDDFHHVIIAQCG